MLVGYARTSTQEQVAGLEAQVAALTGAGASRLFEERVSSVGARIQLDAALDFVRDGDTFVVTKMDRLARSTQHLLEIVNKLERKGVALRILDFKGESIDTRSPQGKLILTMFGAFAESSAASCWSANVTASRRPRAKGNIKGASRRLVRRPNRCGLF